LLNVSIPDVSPADFKGIKICKQARSCWIEKYIEKPTYDGRISYLLTGDFISTDDRTDTDLWALENGYVSVVPVHLDMTANFAIPYLLKMERIQYNNLL
jgi:5'-nucleotidase